MNEPSERGWRWGGDGGRIRSCSKRRTLAIMRSLEKICTKVSQYRGVDIEEGTYQTLKDGR